MDAVSPVTDIVVPEVNPKIFELLVLAPQKTEVADADIAIAMTAIVRHFFMFAVVGDQKVYPK